MLRILQRAIHATSSSVELEHFKRYFLGEHVLILYSMWRHVDKINRDLNWSSLHVSKMKRGNKINTYYPHL